MATYPQIVRGSAAWLYHQVSSQLATINSELSSSVVSAASAPQFFMSMGDPLNPTQPTLCVCYHSTQRTRFAQHNYQFDLGFKILCLIPHAGDNSCANFEMARQVAADNLMSLLSDEALTLAPVINAGILGNVQTLCTDFDDLIDIEPRKQADGKTYVRGFEIPVAISLTLKSHA